MADPRIAMRALQQIRGGGANPVALARRAILSRSSLPQDYYDPEQEALDSMDEMDPEAYATPGDPYPGRPFDPGDESRAAAIDAYNRGPKPGADPRGFMRDDERGEAMMGIDDDESTEYGPTGTIARGEYPRSPRNAAEAVNALGPVFAGLGRDSAYTGTPRATTAPMGERYAAAGSAPSVGGTPEELDAEKRRILAGL